METNAVFSEHQVVLQQVNDKMNKVAREYFKFNTLDAKYNLQMYYAEVSELSNAMEQLNAHLEEYRRISSLIKPEYSEELLNLLCDLEDKVGQIERDSCGNLHCNKCLVAYTFGQDLVGKKVRISHITLNTNKRTNRLYPAFANHIEVLEQAKEEKPFFQKLLSFLF